MTRRLDGGNNSRSNAAFYRGNRRSSWLMVAYGMVGASVSGVSFVSVPGMTLTQGMTYLQTCLGFIPGYIIVAFVLLPIFYRLNLTSIYSLLDMRLGRGAYTTGAWFFIVSDMLGSAVKFLLVCTILQRFVMDDLGVPFVLTVPLLVVCIWLYTRRGGVRTLVYTDVLQTTCMLLALTLIIWDVADALQPLVADAATPASLNPLAADAAKALHPSYPTTPLAVLPESGTLVPPAAGMDLAPYTRVFEFSDWTSRQNFCKQFISGAFIVVVMTGLNQNMMQKNLTCRTLRDAQKNMCLSGLLFLPVNALFLILGLLLIILFQQTGTPLPTAGDDLLPTFIDHLSANVTPTYPSSPLTVLPESGTLAPPTSLNTLVPTAITLNTLAPPTAGLNTLAPTAAGLDIYFLIKIAFVLGIVSAAFSTADSSLTALTTSYCVDIASRPDDVRLRRRVHLAMAATLILAVYALRAAGSGSLIDLVYTLVSYTYGPLLGLFALALLQKNNAPSTNSKGTSNKGALSPLTPATPAALNPLAADAAAPLSSSYPSNRLAVLPEKEKGGATIPLRLCLPVCLAAPAACYVLNQLSPYKFGYELLLLNAALTFIALKSAMALKAKTRT